jgi:4-coumarate--CoA ligase
MLCNSSLGCIATLANYQHNAKEFQFQLEDSTASVLIVHPICLAVALEAAKAAGFPLSKIFLFGGETIDGIKPYTDLLGHREAVPVVYTEEEVKEQPAFLCYSSGTSGKQKGVMITHYNTVANLEQYKAMEEPKMHSNLVFIGVLVSYTVITRKYKIH